MHPRLAATLPLLVRLLCAGAALAGLTACASLPGERQVRRFLGLERTFAHNDLPAPPTPSAYVVQLAMSRTQRIVVREPSGRQFEVTDPRAIQEVLGVLRAGPHLAGAPGAAEPVNRLQLEFIIGPPPRTVTAHYNAASDTLQLYNVPTEAWPDHIVGTYPVAPGFGAALAEALGLSP